MSVRHPLALLLASALLAIGSGCVTMSRGREMQRDILALQAQFDELRSEKEKLKETLTRASKEIDTLEATNREANEVLRRNSADFGAQMDGLRNDNQKLRGALEEARHDLDALKRALEELAAKAARPVGPAPLPADMEGLYAFAFEAHEQGRLDDALRGFRAYAKRFPDDKRADNATYFVGEVLARQGKFVDAVVTLQEILKHYPDGDKVDDAILGIGTAFEALGKCNEAHVFYEDLVKKHADSKLVGTARERLKQKCK